MTCRTELGASTPPSAEELARPLIVRLQELVVGRTSPLFVGLDGRSGAGKSTVAAELTRLLAAGAGGPVTVIEGDQFYGGGSAATWDGRTAAEKVDGVIDWRRQRLVLEALRTSGLAEWRPFDWDSDDWDADEIPLSRQSILISVAPIVVLEGAYSCRPELHDLLDLRALLEIPRDIRRARLLDREGEEYRADWEGRWSAAEDHYFGTVMPPDRFDIVLGFTRSSRTGAPG